MARPDRYQTTIPEPVRQSLGLGKRDKIRYRIRPDGDVTLHRVADAPGDDPLIDQFLGFLARDIANHPDRLQALDAGLGSAPSSSSIIGCSSVTTCPAS